MKQEKTHTCQLHGAMLYWTTGGQQCGREEEAVPWSQLLLDWMTVQSTCTDPAVTQDETQLHALSHFPRSSKTAEPIHLYE